MCKYNAFQSLQQPYEVTFFSHFTDDEIEAQSEVIAQSPIFDK